MPFVNKEVERRISGRKRDIRTIVRKALRDQRTELPFVIDIYQPAKSEFNTVLKTDDGEFYIVTVTRARTK